jgi:hypothetical protein
MANGAFKFKDNSGNVVSFISGSGSNITFSGGTLDLSGMTGLTLGNLTLSGTTQNAISTSHAASYLLTSSFNTYTGTTDTIIGTLQTSTSSLNSFTSSATIRLNSIETSSGSLNSYTSSNDTKLGVIESTTGSLNSYTSSNTTNINAIHTSTGSLNSFTSSATTRLNSVEGVSGSYATTGSNQFKNDQVITGSLTVTGFIDAQELRTTYISSSILYRSGSTKFGDELSDTHAFTGSMLISGSVSTTGNVGIGTNVPVYLLELAKNAEAGDGANLALYNNSFTAGGFTRIRLGRSNTREASIKVISTQNGGRNNDIVFESKRGDGGDDTTFAENMRIKAGGNIGIGIIDPTTLLDIVGSNSAELGALRIYNSAGSPGSQNSVSLLMQVRNSINNLPSVKLIAQESTNDSNLGELIVQTSNDNSATLSEVVRIAQSGAGGARFIRMASGTGGIQFNGDSAAANALDDYEEGTWTPVPTSAGATFNTVVSGSYTKIGRLVYIRLSLDNSSATTGTLTNPMTITNLPFTSSPGSGYGASLAIGFEVHIDYPTGGLGIQALIPANTTYIGLRFTKDDESGDDFLASNFDFPDARIALSGCYEV